MTNGWIRACSAADIPREDVKRVEIGGRVLAVYRTAKDEYFATAAMCTHEAADLTEGFVIGDVIECPMHNGRFDIRTGKAKGAPACIDLETHPVKVEGGAVFVRVS